MKPELVKQLVSLNAEFYSQFAEPFSETRPSGSARLERILGYIPNDVRLLDIGCGNGRLAERLEREGRRLTYVGVDAIPALIQIATERRTRLRHVAADFRVAEITTPGWDRHLPARPFDVVVALALLHHIPSLELRRRVLMDIQALLRPGGQFVMTNWHFARNERLRKKVAEWKTVGIDESEVEPGDALLTWRRGGTGYRYCHLLTQSEVKELAASSGLTVVEQFYADADLNLYSVLTKPVDDDSPRSAPVGRRP